MDAQRIELELPAGLTETFVVSADWEPLLGSGCLCLRGFGGSIIEACWADTVEDARALLARMATEEVRP